MSTINETPAGSRLHISILRAAEPGKSSLINALTINRRRLFVGAGTTTDPVAKGDGKFSPRPGDDHRTAGIDDSGELGALRVEKTLRVIDRTEFGRAGARSGRHRAGRGKRRFLLGGLRAGNRRLVVALTKADLESDGRAAREWARGRGSCRWRR